MFPSFSFLEKKKNGKRRRERKAPVERSNTTPLSRIHLHLPRFFYIFLLSLFVQLDERGRPGADRAGGSRARGASRYVARKARAPINESERRLEADGERSRNRRLVFPMPPECIRRFSNSFDASFLFSFAWRDEAEKDQARAREEKSHSRKDERGLRARAREREKKRTACHRCRLAHFLLSEKKTKQNETQAARSRASSTPCESASRPRDSRSP